MELKVKLALNLNTILQDFIILTFDADVKLEAMEEDRFMVCCMEDINLCDQVTRNTEMTRI